MAWLDLSTQFRLLRSLRSLRADRALKPLPSSLPRSQQHSGSPRLLGRLTVRSFVQDSGARSDVRLLRERSERSNQIELSAISGALAGQVAASRVRLSELEAGNCQESAWPRIKRQIRPINLRMTRRSLGRNRPNRIVWAVLEDRGRAPKVHREKAAENPTTRSRRSSPHWLVVT